MSKVFESWKLGKLNPPNRLVRSATWEGMADPEGRATERLAGLYRDLAAGGVGLIITGYAFVRPDGRQAPWKLGLHDDGIAGSCSLLTRAVHDAGGLIAVQLVHAGGQTSTQAIGRKPYAPSAVEKPQFDEMTEALPVAEIQAIATAFGDAARRAKAAGFDAVQLHASHGYLINQFLSPLTNRRTDDYGGSPEKRRRFLMEVYRSVRKAVGPDYPVFVKLNGADFMEGGLQLDDAVAAARQLDAEGIDAIEVSGGTPASGDQGPVRAKIKERKDEGYNLPLARRIKPEVRCPVIVVGGFRSLDLIEEVLERGDADAVAIARPFIREPGLANRWKGGDRSRAHCVSCNKCFRPAFKGVGIYCVKEKDKS